MREEIRHKKADGRIIFITAKGIKKIIEDGDMASQEVNRMERAVLELDNSYRRFSKQYGTDKGLLDLVTDVVIKYAQRRG